MPKLYSTPVSNLEEKLTLLSIIFQLYFVPPAFMVGNLYILHLHSLNCLSFMFTLSSVRSSVANIAYFILDLTYFLVV